MRRFLVLLVSCVAACHGSTTRGPNDGAASAPDGAASAPGDAAPAPGDAGALTPCAFANLAPVGACYALTPVETGADPSGANATSPNVAMGPAPAATDRHQLFLYFNGSGGHPNIIGGTPSTNLYDTAASLGYHVLGVSYRSDDAVGMLCVGHDTCFYPTRQTIILGANEPGSAITDMRLDEGIADRTVLALRHLAAHDPSWGEFLTNAPSSAPPEMQLDWSKVAVSGESQGGGHAAAIGRMFAIARVLQLSSPCDQVLGTPASWTSGASGTWATDPSTFWGLGVQTMFTGNAPTGGDTTCPAHLAIWQNLGMPTSRYSDDASTCGGTSGPHGAPHDCADNAPFWQMALQ